METTTAAANAGIHAAVAEPPPAQTTTSIPGLVRNLITTARTFFRQRLQLAQVKLLEKAKRLGRDATRAGVGGLVAFIGSIPLLISLGLLIAWGFYLTGAQVLFAKSLGLLAAGLCVLSLGGILVLKALKTMSQEPLSPQGALQTFQGVKTSQSAVEPASVCSRGPSSTEVKARIETTQDRVDETFEELGRRFSSQHINARIKQRIRARPYRSGLIALGAGLFGGLLLRRRFRHA